MQWKYFKKRNVFSSHELIKNGVLYINSNISLVIPWCFDMLLEIFNAEVLFREDCTAGKRS